MNCPRTHELLSPLLDGELPLDLSRSVLAHLDRCARCRREADALRLLSGVLRGAREKAPVGLGARILGEARCSMPRQRSWTSYVAVAWPRAAALILGAVAGAQFLSFLSATPVSSPAESRSSYHLLAFESQAELELGGSFRADFQMLARRPEGRLLDDLLERR